MAEKIATRAAYGKALVELADQEPNLVVLEDRKSTRLNSSHCG